MRTPRPVRTAYETALDVACSNCRAEPGQWCTRDDGMPKRIPCVARLAAAGATDQGHPHNFDEPRTTEGTP
ncbi:zinc finger domain-containing protein [Mycobacterium terramassiliense]|uniref:zinc finger domain-containing protein n=1 Tax=Mycobacterium terramassiliense TaxID=1841859 RepID=UPI0012FFC69A|nr:hypothetical protein [Mycobacterium terramassiliense]